MGTFPIVYNLGVAMTRPMRSGLCFHVLVSPDLTATGAADCSQPGPMSWPEVSHFGERLQTLTPDQALEVLAVLRRRLQLGQERGK